MNIRRISNEIGVREKPKVKAPPYWEDICPTCKTKAVTGCRCMINERTCANGHTWYWKNGEVILGSCH